MERILALVHVEGGGAPGKTALETLAAAKELAEALSAPMDVGLAGGEVAGAANAVASCGADRFFGVSGSEFAQARYATDSAAAEALCRASGATIVVAAGTSRWSRVMSGVAWRLGGRADTHVTSIRLQDGAPLVTRWYYRQRMEAVLGRSHRPWVILLDPGCSAAWAGEPGAADVQTVAAAAGSRTSVQGFQAPETGQQTIRPDAALLFVAGAGWTKNQADGKPHVEEAGRLILGFLDRTGASLGSSKSLVDLSGEGQAVLPFLTHLNQIGQTGATPRHPKGLATCCHGEEPHAVGWRFITERRAVNLDPNCGWARGKADVLYVADAFAVVAKVNELLG